MVEPSNNSTKSGRRGTTRTAKLTQGMALEIFQQAILECQKTGIDVRLLPEFYSNGARYIAVLMADVQMVNGNLVPVNGNVPDVTGKGEE